MKSVRIVRVGVVVPWLVCAALAPACSSGEPGPDPGVAVGSTSSGGSSGAPMSSTASSTPPSGCDVDTNTTACTYPASPYSCWGSDSPDRENPALHCEGPQSDGGTGRALYCCVDSSPGGGGGSRDGGDAAPNVGGCDVWAPIQCPIGLRGIACEGDTPDQDGLLHGSYDCSDPTPEPDGSQGYCCYWSGFGVDGGACVAGSVKGCPFPGIGFTCPASSTPEAQGTLQCTVVPNLVPGPTRYCCQ